MELLDLVRALAISLTAALALAAGRLEAELCRLDGGEPSDLA